MITTKCIPFIIIRLVAWPLIYASSNVGDFDYSVQIFKNTQHRNVIFSPLSIDTAFGMLYIGAQGESKLQMKRFMFSNLSDDLLLSKVSNLSDLFNAHSGDFNITLANRVWAKKDFPFMETYLNSIRTKFSSDIVPVQKFGDPTVAEINRWVEDKTNDKIKNILKPGSLNDATRLVLVNALHLKALWMSKFWAGSTRDQTFYSTSAKNVTVKMMGNPDGEHFPYFENKDVQILGLNFRQDLSSDEPQLAMYVILPKERFGLINLESKASNLAQLLSLIKQTKNVLMGQVNIPKFKTEFDLDLVDTLKSVGVRDIFNGTTADLSKINGKKNLYVSNAIHKAFIEVTETGVEAAAATVIVAAGASFNPAPRKNFIADHPFLFAIVDTRHYTPLFVGRFVGN